MGVHAKNWPKVTYVTTDFIFMLLAFILQYVMKPIGDKYFLCNFIKGVTDYKEECFGITTIMRMSWALCMFHLLMLIIILPRIRCSQAFHDGIWPIKIILVIGFFMLAHAIPVEFYVNFWVHAARFGSVVFFLIQTYMLLDLGYKWNEQLLAGNKDETEWAYKVMMGYTITLFLINIAVVVILFVYFTPREGKECTFGLVVLIPVAIMTLFFLVAGFMRPCAIKGLRENFTPFVAATGVTYITYLAWTTLSSVPASNDDPKKNTDCWYTPSVKYNVMLNVFIGSAFTCATIMSIATASRTAAPSGAQVEKDKTSYLGDALAEKVDKEAAAENEEDKKIGLFPVTKQTIIFQAILMFASLYYAMLFSNWGDSTGTEGKTSKYYSPWIAFWIKFINLILASVLFTLSLIHI